MCCLQFQAECVLSVKDAWFVWGPLQSPRWSKDDDAIPLDHASGDEYGDDDDDDVRAKKKINPPKKKGKAKAKAKGKARAAKANVAPGMAYKPGDYSQARIDFIAKLRKKHNISFREASDVWKSSHERASLLAGMSESEKKKRRFT